MSQSHQIKPVEHSVTAPLSTKPFITVCLCAAYESENICITISLDSVSVRDYKYLTYMNISIVIAGKFLIHVLNLFPFPITPAHLHHTFAGLFLQVT